MPAHVLVDESAPTEPTAADDTTPWPRITIDTPGAEFEPRPPGQFAYDVPDTECDGWSTPYFTVRTASIRGAGHRFYRKPRQDSARAAAHEASGAIVFAVADSVSSTADSHLGALEACRAAIERMLHLLSQDAPMDFDSVAHHAAERLRQLAARRSGTRPQPSAAATSPYATSLVAGVIQPDTNGPKVQLCRIGNSGAWLLHRATGSYHALFGPTPSSDTHAADLASDAMAPLPHVPESVEAIVDHLTATGSDLAELSHEHGGGHGTVYAVLTIGVGSKGS